MTNMHKHIMKYLDKQKLTKYFYVCSVKIDYPIYCDILREAKLFPHLFLCSQTSKVER